MFTNPFDNGASSSNQDDVEELRRDATKTARDIIEGVQENFISQEEFNTFHNNLQERLNHLDEINENVVHLINTINNRLDSQVINQNNNRNSENNENNEIGNISNVDGDEQESNVEQNEQNININGNNNPNENLPQNPIMQPLNNINNQNNNQGFYPLFQPGFYPNDNVQNVDPMNTPRPAHVQQGENSISTRYDLDHDVIMRSRFAYSINQVPEPGFFSGKTSETDLFCQLCEDTFKTYPNRYWPEDAKVNFVQSRLRDSARNWFLAKYKNNTLPATMHELIDGLRTAFNNVASIKLAKIKLIKLKQTYGKINEYIEEFRTYARNFNWDEEAITLIFYNGLHPKYQEEIEKAEVFPINLENIITKCILFENSLNTKNKINQTNNNKSTKKNSKTTQKNYPNKNYKYQNNYYKNNNNKNNNDNNINYNARKINSKN